MRTTNPALKDTTFTGPFADVGPARMTIQGTVNRTAMLLTILVITAGITWTMAMGDNPDAAMPWVIGGAIGGFVLALITIFKNTAAPITAPLYAAAEGLFLGGISALFEQRFPGIALQAIGLTFGTLAALLAAYASGLIRATENFKLGVVAATGAIALFYIASILLGFFGINMPYLHDSGPIGIGISCFIVVIAALNLVLDFDFIEEGANRGAPKHMEWYAAFGLLVTLVWLYLEILRLLAKLRSR